MEYKKNKELNKKRRKASSTPGIQKIESCQKSTIKTRGTKDSRWYRTDPKGYEAFRKLALKLNGYKS